ncbi:glycosyltransferase [Hyphobacterium sp. CCMP332]|nr:glycosyltransferase [Hyphobacterium sp. CCMP332]
MKRIVFTVSNDLNFDQRMIKICTSLSNAGFDVLIIGFKKKNSIPLGKSIYQKERIPTLFQKGKMFYLEISVRLFFKLLFVRTDIISAVDTDTLLPSYIVAKFRSKKLVFDAHEYFSETSGLVGRSFEKKIWQWLENSLIPRVKNAYTVNESLAVIFKNKFNINFRVVLNTPELMELNKSDKASEHFYIYQGVLNKGRGLEELLQVFGQNNLELRIAGEGPLKKFLKKEIEIKGLGKRIKLLGNLKPEELRDLTKCAFAGFNLIEGKGKSYYYSLANKFFDYIHAEIPQIGMNFPEYKKINERFKVSILIDSFNEINHAIEQLESDQSLCKTMKENTLRAKKVYNWSNEERKLSEIYLSLN